MNGLKLQQIDSIKCLAVIIHNKLSLKPHISSLCRKLCEACGVVCKIRHFSDMKILLLICFSLFQYYIIDWKRAYKTAINQHKCYKTEF